MMEQTGVQKLARVLKVLVTVLFLCNLITLPMVPGIVGMSVQYMAGAIGAWLMYLPLVAVKAWSMFPWWQLNPYASMLSFFLLFCGVCTAVILWQGRRVLDTVLKGTPFSAANAGNMRRTGICCFLISLAACTRLVWSVWYFGGVGPLFTYNALFIPIFLMGGLLCLVMSALFRQAAELKAENDLTI